MPVPAAIFIRIEAIVSPVQGLSVVLHIDTDSSHLLQRTKTRNRLPMLMLHEK